MGFVSFIDAKTKLSIPAYPYADLPKEASHVVVVLPNNATMEGVYDGYGNIDGKPIVKFVKTQWESHWPKTWWQCLAIVRKANYNGESFTALGASECCTHQGYFYSEEIRQQIINSVK